MSGAAFAIVMLGATACGPMPGYQMPQHEEVPQEPRSPPAPQPARPTVSVDDRARPGAKGRDEGDAPDPGTDDQSTNEEQDDGTWREPEPEPEVEERAPRPPRYTPPRNWDGPAPARTTRPEPPAPEPVAPEPEPVPVKTDGIKIVRLDADSYYLIDSLRKLCFLRHKESMTALDCAKIPEAGEVTRVPASPTPARSPEPDRMPEPTRQPEQDRMPEPGRKTAPEPEPAKREEGPRTTSPTPDEMVRFEGAFIDIYCDRKLRDETAPESRIRERGLSTVRYESIEAWWAADENAWYTLTTRASKSCSGDK